MVNNFQSFRLKNRTCVLKWIKKQRGSNIDGGEIDTLLAIIEKEMKDASTERQAVMNHYLVGIAVKYPGERIGKLDNKTVPKGCNSSFAPEWIVAVVNKKM